MYLNNCNINLIITMYIYFSKVNCIYFNWALSSHNFYNIYEPLYKLLNISK